MNGAAFLGELTRLAPARAQLCDDPLGASWLPPRLLAATREDPDCAELLADYVAFELGAVAADAPRGDLFASRVLARTGGRAARRARAVNRRGWVLALTHALALVAGLAVLAVELGPGLAGVDTVPQLSAATAAQLRTLVHDAVHGGVGIGEQGVPPWWLLVAGAAGVLALAGGPLRSSGLRRSGGGQARAW